MKQEITRIIEIPEGITVQVDGTITVKGKSGENKKELQHPKIDIKVSDNTIQIHVAKGTKREKKLIGTYASLISNMIKGANEPFKYKLKICSGHFPMNISTANNELIIKNFLGESVPRKLKLKDGVNIKIDGGEIEVTSTSKELAGQTAADIERLCRIKRKDSRIFQDGCYIISKPRS